MNKPLGALSTKLTWQLNNLSQKMRSVEQQITNLEQELDSNQQKISNSCTIPALILPELEIARSHFITQQQQQQNEMNIRKTALQSECRALKLQQTRLNMELKMLENHQETKLKTQQQQALLNAQNQSDEWILQRGEHQ